MYDDRYERKRERIERKLARKAEKLDMSLDDSLPLENLSGPELDVQLRKRAERRIKRRNDFYKGIIAYVAINGLLWAIWLSSWISGGVASPPFPWPMIVTFFWGIGLAGEAYQVYQNSGAVVARREDVIQREIALEKMRLGLANDAYEKPKRDQAMRLSDDGELVPADDDAEPMIKTKRS